jgi:16S rRNA (cytosine1402-N4)-methyltransferase
MGAAHVSVLVRETVELLAPGPGLFVDVTAGAGGHAEALLEANAGVRVLACDRDPAAIELCRTRLGRFGERVRFRIGRFGDLDALLGSGTGERPRGILADLGVSSMQLDRAERGFSFRRRGPLDMRMGDSPVTAADIIAAASARDLARIFREFGEERMANKIAQRIVEEREKAPITTTTQLSALIASVVGRRGRIDPATRVFQALRIEINQELTELSRFLKTAVERLDRGGRIAVISYHSLEDRCVKEEFRRGAGECFCPPGLPACVCGARRVLRVLTPRPIRPGAREDAANPRSRSAKLRAAEKIEATA